LYKNFEGSSIVSRISFQLIHNFYAPEPAKYAAVCRRAAAKSIFRQNAFDFARKVFYNENKHYGKGAVGLVVRGLLSGAHPAWEKKRRR
jgi:hypothetical protein